jgi:hypothetical protein
MSADDERQGRISLWTSIVGLALPVLLLMVFAVLAERNILREPAIYYGLCLLLSAVLEFAALGCGLFARRTGSGKAGLFLSGASLLLLVVFMALTAGNVVVGRVQEEVAPAAHP